MNNSNNIDEVTLNNLPDDCLMEIFKYLPRFQERLKVGRVCKRWNRVVRLCCADSREVVVEPPEYFLRHLQTIIVQGQVVRIKTAGNAMVKGVISLCGPWLIKLSDLPDHKRTTTISEASKQCQQLEEIKVKIHTPVQDRRLRDLGMVNQSLHQLSVEIYMKGTNTWFERLNGASLQRLRIFTEDFSEGHMLNSLATKMLELMNLEEFSINIINDGLLQSIATMTTLENVEISRAHSVIELSEEGLNGILNLKNLRSLYINSANSPQRWCTDTFIGNLAEACPRIERLTLRGNRHISDRILPKLSHLRELKCLTLSNLREIKGGSLHLLINLETLILTRCPKMESVNVEGLLRKSRVLKELMLYSTPTPNSIFYAAVEGLNTRNDGAEQELNIMVDGFINQQTVRDRYLFISHPLLTINHHRL
ncbi:uncharacterized protein LOC107046874 [Diachasma alloeum]|uniref:uncharacterized protein LOC107046874 n=1 Tax=Diachasma alloeum TaxID=454923 RepID=UPI000738199E|nr:uncharacterized protein LOC107046874 [Diachasma alloeum]